MPAARVLPWWWVLVLLHAEPSAPETVVLDYTSRNLSAVPADLPASARGLDLSHNLIRALWEGDFLATPRLGFLNLSWNLVEEIQPGTFGPTPALETLDLSHNRLRDLSRQAYLRQARSLVYLDLSANRFARMELGREFSGLSGLKWLGLGADAVRSGDFRSVVGLRLQTLYFQAENLSAYENGSLTIVRAQRVAVAMPRGHLGFPVIFDALTSFEDVELSGLSDPEDFLGEMLHLRAPIRTTSLCLSSVRSAWYPMSVLINSALASPIRHLDLSGLTLHRILQSQDVARDSSLDSFSIRRSSVTVFIFNQLLLYNFFINMRVAEATFSESPIVHVTCPRSPSPLRGLDLSDCVLTERVFSRHPGVECDTLSSLHTLLLRGNNLRHLAPLTSRVRLMGALRRVDLSRNSLSYGADQGRCEWPGVTDLDLSSNSFDRAVFECLPGSLVNLDLRGNQIATVPTDVSGLGSLRVLDLSSNRLLDLPGCLGYPNLQRLVARANSLHSPSPGSLQTCPDLKVLDISENPFVCTCTLRVFAAMIGSNGTLVGATGGSGHGVAMESWPDGYRCSYPETWRNTALQRFSLPAVACRPELLAVAILVPALLLAVSMAVLCHRLDVPWYLRMIWKWTRAKRRSRGRPEDQRGVDFHAFVSYSQRNADWVKGRLLPELEGDDSVPERARLRVCHHGRDFVPGRPVVQNILRCVERSRRCVFVLSPDFVRSQWCHYELCFANHRTLARGTDELVLLLLEPLPTYLIPAKYGQLRSLMARRTYLEWPQDGAKQRMFWANLRAALSADLTSTEESGEE